MYLLIVSLVASPQHLYCQSRSFINTTRPGGFPKEFVNGKFNCFIFTLIVSVKEFHQHGASLGVF